MNAAPAGPGLGTIDSSRRILVVCHRRLSSFMARDWEIIRAAWPESRLVVVRGARDLGRLGSEVVRADLILCWFGASHAVWAALFNRGAKPLVVVAGGWDVARLPEINYGVYASFPQAPISRWLFRRTDRVLAVSQFNARSIEENAGVPPERIRLIYHGFDPKAWPRGTSPRSLDVLTLAGDHVKVKGLDLLIKAAELMPNVRFQVAGHLHPADLRDFESRKTTNLEFVGRLEGATVLERMQSARVYLQPSRHESFGCAVAEAMLCGCIPVVSRAGALPEVVGKAGYCMDMLTPEHIVLALQPALQATEDERDRARQRIVEDFALEPYGERLRSSLADLLH